MNKQLIPLFILSLTLTACKSGPYTLLLNDNVMYSPNPNANSAGIMADANLQGCLNQVFITSSNNDPEAVTLLACPGAGIQSLLGIEKLINLEQLDLSENAISDLSPLLNQKKLRVLSLRDNRLGNINSLQSLPILRFVSLQGNNNISCRDLDRLEAKLGNTLSRPLSCN